MGTHPPFVFEAQPSQGQIVAAVRHASRKPFWCFRIFGLAVFGYGLSAALADDLSVGWEIGLTVFFALLGAVVGVFLPWFTERRATRISMKLVGLPSAYRIDHEGVRSSNELTDGVIRWPLITGIHEVADLVMVRMDRARFIPIPVGSLPPETRSAMVAFLRAHVGAPIAPAPPGPEVGAVRSPSPSP